MSSRRFLRKKRATTDKKAWLNGNTSMDMSKLISGYIVTEMNLQLLFCKNL